MSEAGALSSFDIMSEEAKDVAQVAAEEQPAARPADETSNGQDVQQPGEGKEAENGSNAIPDDETIKTALRELLKTADLTVTTEKKLRKQLEEKFSCELTEKKTLIRAEVEAFLAEGNEEEEEEEQEEEEEKPSKKKRGRTGAAMGSILSPAMSAFLGMETCPRPQVVKRMWEYIKANNLQDPKNRQKIILDDKMKTIFKHPLTMLNMNKQLNQHCKTADAANKRRKGSEDDDAGDNGVSEEDQSEEEASDGDDGDDSDKGKKAKKKAPAKKKASSKKPNGDGEAKKKVSGFNKPVRISDELQGLLGLPEPEASRPAITKSLWEYFRSNNLLDPSDKRKVICNDKLQQMTGQKTFLAFSLQKVLAKHINVDKD